MVALAETLGASLSRVLDARNVKRVPKQSLGWDLDMELESAMDMVWVLLAPAIMLMVIQFPVLDVRSVLLSHGWDMLVLGIMG